MAIWKWIKGLGWVTALGLIFGAILLALQSLRSQKARTASKRKEDMATDMLNSDISSQIAKGKKLMEAANKDKDRAVVARQAMEEQLAKLGDANEDLDAIADRFNSRRVRQ